MVRVAAGLSTITSRSNTTLVLPTMRSDELELEMARPRTSAQWVAESTRSMSSVRCGRACDVMEQPQWRLARSRAVTKAVRLDRWTARSVRTAAAPASSTRTTACPRLAAVAALAAHVDIDLV